MYLLKPKKIWKREPCKFVERGKMPRTSTIVVKRLTRRGGAESTRYEGNVLRRDTSINNSQWKCGDLGSSMRERRLLSTHVDLRSYARAKTLIIIFGLKLGQD